MQLKYPAFIVLALVLLSACSTKTSSISVIHPEKVTATATATAVSQLHATFDPCTLFTKDQASLVLHAPVTVRPDFTFPLCTYTITLPSDSATSATTTQSNEILVATGSSINAPAYFSLLRNYSQKATTEQSISGIGDAAFSIKLTFGASLVVLQQNTIYSITIVYPHLDDSTMQNALKKLASVTEFTLIHAEPTLALPYPNPCTLIDTRHASRILQNQPVQWLLTANNAGVSSCDYISPGGIQSRVQVVITNNANLAGHIYTQALNAVPQPKILQGIGNAAFYDGYNSLWILKEGRVFHFTLLGIPNTETTLKQLAKFLPV